MLLGLWVLIIFGQRISGAHYNPAVTLVNMLRRDTGKFPRLLGIFYILSQLLGGFVGALLSWFLRRDEMSYGNIVTVNIFPAILSEVLGSFLFTFFFLTQTEEKTKISQEKAINVFVIAASYIGARAMLNGRSNILSGPVLNPAIGLGTNLTMLLATGFYFEYVWIYLLMPMGGAVLSVIFYEFIFKKTQEVIYDEYEEGDNGDELLSSTKD
jgi:glycerol uptake facilitator-like aquaporin